MAVQTKNKNRFHHVYKYLLIDLESDMNGENINFILNSDRDPQNIPQMSRDMRFLTMWYVRPAKAQASLRIRAV